MRFLGGLYSTSQRNQARVDEAARAPRHDPAKKLVMWPLEFPCGGGEADCDSVESTAGWIGRCSGEKQLEQRLKALDEFASMGKIIIMLLSFWVLHCFWTPSSGRPAPS